MNARLLPSMLSVGDGCAQYLPVDGREEPTLKFFEMYWYLDIKVDIRIDGMVTRVHEKSNVHQFSHAEPYQDEACLTTILPGFLQGKLLPLSEGLGPMKLPHRSPTPTTLLRIYIWLY